VSTPLSQPRMEPEDQFRIPSGYSRCRRKRCYQPPVADMRRQTTLRSEGHERRRVIAWWAYCADHLREYNREVRDGRVWWLGTPAPEPEP
jgi:hypothetical protein